MTAVPLISQAWGWWSTPVSPSGEQQVNCFTGINHSQMCSFVHLQYGKERKAGARKWNGCDDSRRGDPGLLAGKLVPQFFSSFFASDAVMSSSNRNGWYLHFYGLIPRSRTSEGVSPALIIHFALEDSHSSASVIFSCNVLLGSLQLWLKALLWMHNKYFDLISEIAPN